MISGNIRRLKLGTFVGVMAIAACWYTRSNIVEYVARNASWEAGSEGSEALFTYEQLKQFDGATDSRLYLAILGRVFDVSRGRKHYEPGATYHFFVGKDGSRSFVTGEFSEDSTTDREDILDLSCSELFSLKSWQETYYKQYIYKGKLIGRHYDGRGHDTEYGLSLAARLAGCEEERRAAERHAASYPPCNIEWSADDGTRVWCTNNSGGVERQWAGVPRRLLAAAGGGEPRCVCVDPRRDHSGALLQLYPGCSHSAAQCTVPAS